MKLIDADALVESNGLTGMSKHGTSGREKFTTRMLYEIYDMVQDAPAIDPESLRARGYNATECHPSDEFVCSECGFVLRDYVRYDPEDDVSYEYDPRYCPDCGAKMDKEGFI